MAKQSKITDNQIVAKLKRKAKTATELSVPIQRLYRMESQGKVRRVDVRKTGKRGRPAVVWSVA